VKKLKNRIVLFEQLFDWQFLRQKKEKIKIYKII